MEKAIMRNNKVKSENRREVRLCKASNRKVSQMQATDKE
jgi:hypothetical protein